jgi:hypothetical protein
MPFDVRHYAAIRLRAARHGRPPGWWFKNSVAWKQSFGGTINVATELGLTRSPQSREGLQHQTRFSGHCVADNSACRRTEAAQLCFLETESHRSSSNPCLRLPGSEERGFGAGALPAGGSLRNSVAWKQSFGGTINVATELGPTRSPQSGEGLKHQTRLSGDRAADNSARRRTEAAQLCFLETELLDHSPRCWLATPRPHYPAPSHRRPVGLIESQRLPYFSSYGNL